MGASPSQLVKKCIKKELSPYRVLGEGSFGIVVTTTNPNFYTHESCIKIFKETKDKKTDKNKCLAERSLLEKFYIAGIGPNVMTTEELVQSDKNILCGKYRYLVLEKFDSNAKSFFNKFKNIPKFKETLLTDFIPRIFQLIDTMVNKCNVSTIDMKFENILVKYEKSGYMKEVRLNDFDPYFCISNKDLNATHKIILGKLLKLQLFMFLIDVLDIFNSSEKIMYNVCKNNICKIYNSIRIENIENNKDVIYVLNLTTIADNRTVARMMYHYLPDSYIIDISDKDKPKYVCGYYSKYDIMYDKSPGYYFGSSLDSGEKDSDDKDSDDKDSGDKDSGDKDSGEKDSGDKDSDIESKLDKEDPKRTTESLQLLLNALTEKNSFGTKNRKKRRSGKKLNKPKKQSTKRRKSLRQNSKRRTHQKSIKTLRRFGATPQKDNYSSMDSDSNNLSIEEIEEDILECLSKNDFTNPSKISKGTFGTVFSISSADDCNAVKVFRDDLSETDETCKNEFEINKFFYDKGIAPKVCNYGILRNCEHGIYHYFTMEKFEMDGGDYIETYGKNDIYTQLFLREILQLIDNMFTKCNVATIDIKPKNIVVNLTPPKVRLIDFGTNLSIMIDTLTNDIKDIIKTFLKLQIYMFLTGYSLYYKSINVPTIDTIFKEIKQQYQEFTPENKKIALSTHTLGFTPENKEDLSWMMYHYLPIKKKIFSKEKIKNFINSGDRIEYVIDYYNNLCNQQQTAGKSSNFGTSEDTNIPPPTPTGPTTNNIKILHDAIFKK